VLGPAYTDGNTYGMPGQLLLTSDGGATWQTVTRRDGRQPAAATVRPSAPGRLAGSDERGDGVRDPFAQILRVWGAPEHHRACDG
jgi:hypothetical protein